jgi:hypothetical protein
VPDNAYLLPPLVRAGRWVVNLIHLITSEEKDWPERGAVEVVTYPGRPFTLLGKDADDWREGLSAFAPGGSTGPVAGSGQVLPGGPGAAKKRQPRR